MLFQFDSQQPLDQEEGILVVKICYFVTKIAQEAQVPRR